jgi:hypothetical protein
MNSALKELSPRETWTVRLLNSGMPVDAILLGMTYASLAREDGTAVSAAEAHLAQRLHVSRGRLNVLAQHLREKGWISRAPEPRRWVDEHMLTMPTERGDDLGRSR